MSTEEKKEAKVPVYKQKCPVCSRPSINAISIDEGKDVKGSGLWYFCSCGVVFNRDMPDPVVHNQSYIDNYNDIKGYNAVSKQLGRTYAPIIEEAVYGRKMLDVGFCTEHNMKFFKDRGWITYGMDTNKDIVESDRIMRDSFETTDKLYQESFDCIWMGHVLEQFQNPLGAIAKAKVVLEPGGVLFITTPDIDFMSTIPHADWQHWKKDENNIMWSERALCKQLEAQGFTILVKFRNYYQRFGFYHDLHILCQKVFY